MDWGGIIKEIIGYLLKTGFKRFLSGLVVIGATLLGLSWVDVAAILADHVPGEHSGEQFTAVAQLTGVALVVVGVAGRILVHILPNRTHERQSAAKLIRRIRVIANGFREPNVTRDAGYYNHEIVECQAAAKKYLDVAPELFAANSSIAAIASPKFDASKKSPYIDLSVDELDTLVSKLKGHYGIE